MAQVPNRTRTFAGPATGYFVWAANCLTRLFEWPEGEVSHLAARFSE